MIKPGLLDPKALRNLGFLTVSLFMLSACVTMDGHQSSPVPQASKQAAWETHYARVQSLQEWWCKGRVGGRTNEEGFHAGVTWKQQREKFLIDLYDLLGRKVAVITGRQGYLKLKTSKGQSFEANDSDELMKVSLGYAFPVTGLRHWLLGIPDPDQVYSIQALDEQGRLMRLHQASWLIEYKRYHERAPALPALIRVSNPDLRVNIKIDQWKIEENHAADNKDH